MAAIDEAEIRAAVEEITAWEELARSPQLVKFLRFVVEAQLNGNETAIKAYSIAVDVFNRPENFDPQSDPIVRVQARRLRGLLERYYLLGLNKTQVRISIPVGGYVPRFSSVADAAMRWSRASRIAVVVSAAALIVLTLSNLPFISSLISQTPQPPHMPEVLVGEFDRPGGDDRLEALAEGVRASVLGALSRYPEVSVARLEGTATPPGTSDGGPVFVLGGVIEQRETQVVVAAHLTSVADGQIRWSGNREAPAADADAGVLGAAIALRIGGPQGPIHEAGREWAVHYDGSLRGRETLYACMMLYDRMQETFADSAVSLAAECFRSLGEREPKDPFVLSAGAVIETWALAFGDRPEAIGVGELRPQIAAVREAISLSAEQGFHRAQLAHILFLAGETNAAVQCYRDALALNPGDTNAMAGLGQVLVMAGRREEGVRYVRQAIEQSVSPPPWYHLSQSLADYMDGAYQAAVDAALFSDPAQSRFGGVFIVASAQRAGRQDIVASYLPNLYANARMQNEGILTGLKRFVTDAATVDELAAGLVEAGVPAARLWRGFTP